MQDEPDYGSAYEQAAHHDDEAFTTVAGSGYQLELRAIYYLHHVLAQWLSQMQEENYNFPLTHYQVTSVEIQTFKQLDDRYSGSIWGILDFVDQPGGAFAFVELPAAQMVTGLTEDDVASDEGMDYVDAYLQLFAAQFAACWAEHEVASFDVQMFASPMAPSLLDLQPMFPGLNNKTPIITTSFRLSQPGMPGMARLVLGIPQAYLHPVEASLQAVGEQTYGRQETGYFYERLSYLEDVPIPVAVMLGKAEMTVGDLQGLEEGDVIELNTTVGLPLEVRLGATRLLGKPGVSPDGRRMAVQIVQGEGS